MDRSSRGIQFPQGQHISRMSLCWKLWPHRSTIDSIMAWWPRPCNDHSPPHRRRLRGECTTLISAFINLNNNELIFFLRRRRRQAIFTCELWPGAKSTFTLGLACFCAWLETWWVLHILHATSGPPWKELICAWRKIDLSHPQERGNSCNDFG